MARITNSMLVSNYMINMQRNLNNMSTIQNQLASGKNIQKASENPYIALRTMQLNTEISSNKQYNTNIQDTTNWLDTTDTALGQANNILRRIKELTIKSGNGAYGEDEIGAIKDEIVEKVNELGQVLNTTFDGNYIFGGTKSTSKPINVNDDGNLSYADKYGNSIKSVKKGGNEKIIIDVSEKNQVNGYITVLDPSERPSTPQLSITTTAKSESRPVATIEVNSTTKKIEYKDKDGNTLQVDPGTDSESKLKDMINSANVAIEQISAHMKTEVSDGVTTEYNKTAVEILEFKDQKGNSINTMNVLSDLVNCLKLASGEKTELSDGDGIDPAKAAISKINEIITANIDNIANNISTCRSSVGAIQNRMESAKTTNEEQNYNMTSILSNTDDIDFAEKTMEYSVLQTVYIATLQTSSKVLQNTLLDYV